MELFNAWLEPIKAQIPPDLDPEETTRLAQAITEESLRRFGAFLSGIRQYQSHPAAREETGKVNVIWQQGTTRLLDYAPDAQDAPVLIVVPSLVNRFEILDIAPRHSFLRFLVAEGLRPLVIDWQEPGEDERAFTLDDYMTQRLLPVLEHVTTSTNNKPCHLLGYCMGGLMTLAMSLIKPEAVASLTLLATPWDFAAKGAGGVPAASTMIGSLFLQQAQSWEDYLDQLGYLPAAFLQSVFTGFQSLQVLEKFTRFGTEPLNEDEARRFVLTEDWINNGIPLALPVAKECMRDWYENNATGKGTWTIAGHRIDPSALQTPTYVLIPKRDRIVPPESALPLASLIAGATLHQPDIGHVGIMTGDEAPTLAWQPLAAWLRTQNVH